MSDGPPLPPQLTVRHQQLLRLLAEGITDSEIARRMHLSDVAIVFSSVQRPASP